jgi:hypothetical protein
MKEYVFSVSERGDSERIPANHILREIHDSMCMCGVWDDCDTEGINGTLIAAAHSLLVDGKWHTYFEDGWISVAPVETTSLKQ